MKMYIIIKDSVPDKFAPVIAAHASLACYKKFEDDERMITWIKGIFKKVICSANEKEFERLKEEADYVLLTEAALEHQEVCLAFCPRSEFSKRFRFLRMWKPSSDEAFK